MDNNFFDQIITPKIELKPILHGNNKKKKK